jgi:hypothetical protein
MTFPCIKVAAIVGQLAGYFNRAGGSIPPLATIPIRYLAASWQVRLDSVSSRPTRVTLFSCPTLLRMPKLPAYVLASVILSIGGPIAGMFLLRSVLS